MSVNEEINENKVMDLYSQVRHCEGESEACKEIDRANEDRITMLKLERDGLLLSNLIMSTHGHLKKRKEHVRRKMLSMNMLKMKKT